ncbi:MAG: Uncharacterized protein AWU57_611 [Marinobacter sp. T13-3]|nr:MAG: Uncharacterized protein AWU57_611 [Marinobacter sp. T13-3]
MVPTERALDLVMQVLSRRTFDYSDEKRCQVEIAEHFESLSLNVEREHNFGTGIGVCDFFFPQSGIVVETKAYKSWSKKQVYRQCERYCKQPSVTGLILATGKAQGLPAFIHGKPVRVYQLGRSALQ